MSHYGSIVHDTWEALQLFLSPDYGKDKDDKDAASEEEAASAEDYDFSTNDSRSPSLQSGVDEGLV